MTAPGPAEPTPGAPASPAPAAPVPPATGSPVNPPATPPAPTPAPPASPTPAAPAAVPAQPTPTPPAPAPSTALALPAPAQPPTPAQAAQPPVPAQAAQPPVPAQVAGTPPAPAKAPPKPPSGTTKPKTKTSGAYLVAVFALLIAVAAAGAAVYALKTAIDVRDGNASAPLTEPTVAPDTSATPDPGSTAAATTPTPTQTTPRGPQYVPELVRAELRVPNPTGCTAAYVDVDTGNVGVEAGHEFYFSRCQDPSTLQVRLDRTSGRSTSGPDPSPQTCASLVAGTPSSELVITAQRGVTFCLLTNQAQATSASLPQRLAIVEVLSVTGSELRLALSTYRIEE